MFEYLNGTLESATAQKAIVDVSGIGYLLHISIATFEKLPQIGTPIKLYTSLIVREDSQRLFGFLSLSERDFFEVLNDISGIGPRIAIAILGHMNLNDLHLAVERSDTKALHRIPGIGKKMAERLVLELRDKFKKTELFDPPVTSHIENSTFYDATQALVHLGYKSQDAEKTIRKILSDREDKPPLSELLSLALKVRHH